MKSAFVVLLLSLFVSLLILGCAAQTPPAAQQPATSQPASGGGNANTSSAIQNTVSPPSAPSASKAATVEISSFSFQPATITVDAGTTVTWVNKDSVPHSATSDNGAFDTGTFANGESRSFTFTTPGTYAYHCVIHPSMHGTVQVR